VHHLISLSSSQLTCHAFLDTGGAAHPRYERLNPAVGKHSPPHVSVCVQIWPVGHALYAPTMQEILGRFVGIALQRPLQTDGLVHAIVGVQVEPVGQAPPIVHGLSGGGVVTEIQAPPQDSDDGQAMVGVQAAPAGQPPGTPMVHGITGGGVKTDIQRPWQVIVCVQIEPVGQGTPPTTHGTVRLGVGVGVRVIEQCPP